MGVPKTPGRYIEPVSKIWRRRQAPAVEKTSVDGRLFALKAGEADDEELREVYDFLALVAAHDRAEPDSAPNRTDQERYDTFVSSLFRRGSPESSGHLSFLLARSCGRIAVSIVYTVGGEGDEDLVLIGLTVHPEFRRRGVGTDDRKRTVVALSPQHVSRSQTRGAPAHNHDRAWTLCYTPGSR